MQYGSPNLRNAVASEPSAYPYEIWQYDVLVDKKQVTADNYNRQTNRRFVFYNPDLVSNKYRLLHSDANGELFNSRWQMDLHKRDTFSNDPDTEKGSENFGGNVDENFRNPR